MKLSRIHLFLLSLLASFSVVLVLSLNNDYIVKDNLIQPNYVKKITRSASKIVHHVAIAIKQNNIDVIERMLLERSSPDHYQYQNWLTFEEVGAIIENEVAYDSVITWLKQNEVSIINITPHKDYVRAVTTIEKWESILRTKFYLYEDNHPDRKFPIQYHRAESYSIPNYLDSYLIGIFMVSQPPIIVNKHKFKESAPSDIKHISRERFTKGQDSNNNKPTYEANGYIEPSLLNDIYGITDNNGMSIVIS